MQLNNRTVLHWAETVKIKANNQLELDDLITTSNDYFGHSRGRLDAIKATIRHQYLNYNAVLDQLSSAHAAKLINYHNLSRCLAIIKQRTEIETLAIVELLHKHYNNETRFKPLEIVSDSHKPIFTVGENIGKYQILDVAKTDKTANTTGTRYICVCNNCGNISVIKAKTLRTNTHACEICDPADKNGVLMSATNVNLFDLEICRVYGCYNEASNTVIVTHVYLQRTPDIFSYSSQLIYALQSFGLSENYSFEQLQTAYNRLRKAEKMKEAETVDIKPDRYFKSRFLFLLRHLREVTERNSARSA